jgi:hypothetical protein
LKCTKDGDTFLGATKGIVGVLYVVLTAIRTVHKLRKDVALMDAVKETVQTVMKQMKKDDSCRLPSWEDGKPSPM